MNPKIKVLARILAAIPGIALLALGLSALAMPVVGWAFALFLAPTGAIWACGALFGKDPYNAKPSWLKSRSKSSSK